MLDQINFYADIESKTRNRGQIQLSVLPMIDSHSSQPHKEKMTLYGQDFVCSVTMCAKMLDLTLVDTKRSKVLYGNIDRQTVEADQTTFIFLSNEKELFQQLEESRDLRLTDEGVLMLPVDIVKKGDNHRFWRKIYLKPHKKIQSEEQSQILFDIIRNLKENVSELLETRSLSQKSYAFRVQTEKDKRWVIPHPNSQLKSYHYEVVTHQGMHTCDLKAKEENRSIMFSQSINQPTVYNIQLMNLNRKKWLTWGVGAASTLEVANFTHEDYLNYDYNAFWLRDSGVDSKHAPNYGGLNSLLQLKVNTKTQLVQWLVDGETVVQCNLSHHLKTQPIYFKMLTCFKDRFLITRRAM